MDMCFLFTKTLDEQGCYCFRLNQEGLIVEPPQHRSFADIKILQNHCKTMIVETSLNASILDLELPWLPERKARTAIPYALEDRLAQPVEELHFAFDKLRYQNNQYTIAVISKLRIHVIINILDSHQIDFDMLTLDWFALSPQELCVTDNTLLVYMNELKGALSPELISAFKTTHPNETPLLFADSCIEAYQKSADHNELSTIWIAKRLLQIKPLNLLQGEMQHSEKTNWIKKGYQLSGILCITWIILILCVNTIHLYQINKKNDEIDKQIAVIYHQFFPEAKQVISPKFRISQLLSSKGSDSQSQFWFILNQFSKVMKNSGLTVQQLRYHNKTVKITLTSPDFISLEKIENNLKSLNINVKQTQASSKDQQVIATLELT